MKWFFLVVFTVIMIRLHGSPFKKSTWCRPVSIREFISYNPFTKEDIIGFLYVVCCVLWLFIVVGFVCGG